MRRLVPILLLLACASGVFARIAVVRTLNGTTFTGNVRFMKKGVVIVNSAQSLVVTVAATNVALVAFPQEVRPVTIEEAAEFGDLPAGWQETEIGTVTKPGSTRCEGNTFTVRGAGVNMDGESDSFHYVYQPVNGDQEITARVTSIQDTHPSAKAGLMMRETLSDYARCVTVAATAERGGSFQSRYFEGRAAQVTAQPEVRPPFWLKLRRRGQEFTGYRSPDGRHWTLIEQTHLPMAENFYVGLAVASAEDDAVNWTTFDRVRSGSRVLNDDFVPQVELTSGSIILGRPSAASPMEMAFLGGPRIVRVPTARVARILYQPLTLELAWKTRASRPGVWVQNGDFFDGDFQRIEGDRLRVSSVLYGLRTFDVGEEVMAVVLQRARIKEAAVEIDGDDGSLLLGTSFVFGEGEVLMKEAALGQVQIPAYAMREMRVAATSK